MSKFIFIFALLTFLVTTVSAQNLMQPSRTKDNYSIPFHLTSYNNIVLKAVLNNRDTVNLMLHTASSDLAITEDALRKLKTIKFDGAVDSVKSWGGSSNSSDFSKNNSLTIANISWDSILIWKDKNSGKQTDGKFGLNLFENKVLEIDFDRNLLTVKTKMPRKIIEYDKFQLFTKNDEMFIKAICQTEKGSFANEFLLHSGYSGGVLLDDKFVNENNIAQQINITGEKKLKDAFGNVLTTKNGTLPLFKIGRLQLANVPIAFFEGAIGRQKISIIGGDILKRFNWIIDAKRQFIYLKPNNLFKTNFSNI
ncbi:MAG: hypothetical protein ABIO53_12455 [Chitinophagaceae bacterium]